MSTAIVEFADRNLDVVVLTTNTTDLEKRIWYAADMLALDGLLSQAGEVFMKVTNFNTTHNMTLVVPRVYGHSPYFTMHTSQPVRALLLLYSVSLLHLCCRRITRVGA